jgi:hypothetical protein
MVPDSRVFIPWRLQRFETHSALSLFTFSLPLGLAMYWLFQYLIKVPMIEVLPDGAHARWQTYEPPAPIANPVRWLAAACGVLAGAFTHLIWDAFTHEGARGVRMLPMLDEPVFDIGHHHVMFTRAMQDISSLLGLLAVIAMLAYGLRPGREAPVGGRVLAAPERRLWTGGFVLASLALWTAFTVPAYISDPNHGVGWLVYDSAIASLRALATAVILFAAAIQVRLRAFPQERSSGPGR